jgi:mono/diheme cytochrome c family protein
MNRFLIAGLVVASAAFAADTQAPKPTFTKDMLPIFQEKCQDCHRAGGMAPFSLESYEATRPWARSIKERVVARQMPPWHMDPHVGIQKFQNDMSLTDAQIKLIADWVDAGAPKGDPKDAPAAKTWPNDAEWQLAKVFGRGPDMVIKSTPYTMPAVSQDQWWRPVVDLTDVKEPVWVRAVEMKPGTPAGRKITHHALAHLIQDDPDARKYSSFGNDPDSVSSPNEAGTLMEWAVGKNYDIYRENTGKLLLPGSKVWWDIHYHAVGEQVTDIVELGVWLYPKGETPKYRTYLTGFTSLPARTAGGGGIDIAPNSKAQYDGYTVLKAAARLENFQPHFHLRGKAMELEAILPDGTRQTISLVDHFNFNWMTNYIYADDAAPVFPKGTIIHVTSWYDNTAGNRFNPDPNQWVGYGDRTVDEMGHAWVNVTYISDEDYAAWAAAHGKGKPAQRETTGGAQ